MSVAQLPTNQHLRDSIARIRPRPARRSGRFALIAGAVLIAALALSASPAPPPASAQGDLIAYRMVDQWPEREAAAEGLLQTPIDLDVAHDDRVFIADAGIGGVHTLLPSGVFTTPFGVAGGFPAQLGSVGPIAVGPAAETVGGTTYLSVGHEHVYVLDTAIERVVVYDADGEFVTAWDGINGQSIAASSDGRVYVLDRDSSQVRAFDSATGDERFTIGIRGTEDGQFTNFTDVDVSEDGRVLVVGDNRGQRAQLFDLATDGALAGEDPPEPATLRRAYDLRAAKYTSGDSTCRANRVNALGGDRVFVGEATSACIIDARDVTFAIASSASSGTICRDTVRLPRVRASTGQYFALATSDPNAGKCGEKRTDLETTPVVVKYADESLRVVETVWAADSNENLDNPILFSPNSISMPAADVIFVSDSSSQLRFFSLAGEQVAVSERQSFSGDRTTEFTFFRILEASGSDVLGEVFGYYIEGRRSGGGGRPPGPEAAPDQGGGFSAEVGVGRFRTVDKRTQQGIERVIEPVWTDAEVVTGRFAVEVPALAWNPVSSELLVVKTEIVEAQRTQDTFIARYTAEGRKAGEPFDLPDDGSINPYVDLVVGPDGRILALDDVNDTVHVYDADGTPVVEVPVAFDARAVAGGPPSPDGTVFALREPGSIERYADDGTITARLDGRPLDFSDPTTLTDLVVDGAGRVYVSDGQSSLISVFEMSPDADEIPIPNDAECLFKGKQTADPLALQLGESTDVTLEILGRCGVDEEPADIVVVVPYFGRLQAGVDPARGTINELIALMARLNFGKHRVGIVSYYNTTTVELELTGERADYLDAVVDMTRFDPPNENVKARLRDAMEAAQGVLGPANGRRQVMLLLHADYCSVENERRPGQCAGYPPAEDTALAVRQSGVTIIAVGPPHAWHLASSDEDAMFESVGVHRRMVQYRIPDMLATDVTLTDEVPGEMDVDEASISAGGVWQAPHLVWQLPSLDLGGGVFQVSLTPNQGGRWPVSASVEAQIVDGYGAAQQVSFPIPEIEVVAPTPEATEVPPTATPGPTATPRPLVPLYIPIAHLTRCVLEPVPVDVVLLVDISSSMGAPTSDGGPTKIEAARTAAAGFVSALRDIDRVGLVAFDEDVTVHSDLSFDRAGIRSLVEDLETGYGTRIDLGLSAATEVLSVRRADATPVLVLLTDGRPSTDPDSVRGAAAAARAAGIDVYAIGLGADIDAELLIDVAGAPERYLEAPEAGDLQRVYEDLLTRVVQVCR